MPRFLPRYRWDRRRGGGSVVRDAHWRGATKFRFISETGRCRLGPRLVLRERRCHLLKVGFGSRPKCGFETKFGREKPYLILFFGVWKIPYKLSISSISLCPRHHFLCSIRNVVSYVFYLCFYMPLASLLLCYRAVRKTLAVCVLAVLIKFRLVHNTCRLVMEVHYGEFHKFVTK